MATRGNTKLSGFYFPWPLRNVQFARQIDQSRENTYKLAPLTRAAYVDPQPVTANAPGEHDLSGWAVGMRDFRNKFRIYYDQQFNRFSIQHNVGTEAVETWDDMILIRESDGRVTIVQDGGLEAQGGFYNQVPRNLATSGRFEPPSFEWAFTHNLNTKPILWDTYNLEDKSIIPVSVDVSDPNTAYFYFSQAYSGFAVVTGEQSRFSGIRVDDGNGNVFPTATRLGFNGAQFYASTDDHGMPVLNLQPLDFSDSDTSTLPVNLIVEDSGLSQVFDLSDLTIPPKIVFNQADFYLMPDGQGNPIINIRGGAGGGSSSQFGTGIQAQNFTTSSEWTFNHNLGVDHIIWSVFDDNGLAVIPEKVSTHNSNIAYFYFTPAMAGRAVVAGGPLVNTITVAEVDGSPSVSGVSTIKVTNGTLTDNLDGSVTISTGGGGGGSLTVGETDGTPPDFTSVTTLEFNSTDFYISPSSTGVPIVNFRGSSSSSGSASEFSDSTFKILDNVDQTKIIQFEASDITTATTRTFTMQDRDGTIALVDQLDGQFYRLTVKESDGTPAIKTNTLIFGSTDFYIKADSIGNPIVRLRAAGGSALTVRDIDAAPTVSNVNTIEFTNGTVTDQTGGVARVTIGGGGISTVDDNVHSIGSATALGLNSANFYLSQSGAGKPIINLKYDKDIYPIYVDFPSTQQIAVDPWAQYSYTIEKIDFDCLSGTATAGFYIVTAANRSSARDGTAVTNLDPLNFSNTATTKLATGANTVNPGDKVILSIYQNSASRKLNVVMTCKKA